MKLHGFFITILGVGAVFAQTSISWVDTSIIKNGNTWVYSRQETSSSRNGTTTYQGTTTFTLSGVTTSGGMLTFSVSQTDAGTTTSTVAELYFDPDLQTYVYRTPPPTSSSSSSSTAYAFANNIFSPSTPFFAKGQSFSDTNGRVVYRGDTLRKVSVSSTLSGNGVSSENIERIGRVSERTNAGGGLSSAGSSYRLLSFNGQAYDPDNVQVVSILGLGSRAKQKNLGPILQSDGRRVLLQNNGRFYDLRGGRSHMPTTR
jgi:hypothetical protein